MKGPPPPGRGDGPRGLPRSRLVDLRGLREKRRRRATGLYLVEGFHVVEEALASGAPVVEVLVGTGAALSPAGVRIVTAARAQGLPVIELPRKQIEGLADAGSPQGVLALLRAPAADDPLPIDGPGIVVVLDGVQDPGNAGAIVRAADAFGCAAVVFGRGSVEPVNPKVLRAAQGSHFHLPVVAAGAASEVATAARDRGREVWTTVPQGGTPLWDAPVPADGAVVVFGNEARGVAAEVTAAADRQVTIPLRGRAESLGVAASAAIVLAWLASDAAS